MSTVISRGFGVAQRLVVRGFFSSDEPIIVDQPAKPQNINYVQAKQNTTTFIQAKQSTTIQVDAKQPNITYIYPK